MKSSAHIALFILLSLTVTGCSSGLERFDVEPGYFSPLYVGDVTGSISIECEIQFEPKSFHQKWAPSVGIAISNNTFDDTDDDRRLIALRTFRNPDDDRNHFRIQTHGMEKNRNTVKRGATGGDEFATISLTWREPGVVVYRFEDQEASFLMAGRGPFVPKYWFVTASGSLGSALCETSEH